MKTRNSIDLKEVTEPCRALMHDGCSVNTGLHKECGTYRCPFYKPEGCGDWIRVEDEEGINLIPPEEYKVFRKKNMKDSNVKTWKIVFGRS